MGDSYRVPKRPVEVQLRTPGFGFESATLYLADRAEEHPGPESVCDVLNAPVEFVPVTRRGGALRLVALEQVMTVGVPPDLPDAEAEFAGTVVKVAVLLADGNVIEGGVAYARPAASSRLQDHLNQAGRFIELHTSEGRVLVNKRFISHVGVLS